MRSAKRLAAIQALPPDDPKASLAAFTVPGMAEAISQSIDADLQAPGVTDYTAKYRDGSRVVKNGRAEYLLPTVVHCESPDAAIASKEYMFPFVTVVECPEAEACSTRWARRSCARPSPRSRSFGGRCSMRPTSIG